MGIGAAVAAAVVSSGWAAAGGMVAGAIAGAVNGAIIGAVVGGLSAAITGGDIGSGILMGAVGGFVGGAVLGAFNPAAMGVGGAPVGAAGEVGLAGAEAGLTGVESGLGQTFVKQATYDIGKGVVGETVKKGIGTAAWEGAKKLGGNFGGDLLGKGLEQGLGMLMKPDDPEQRWQDTKEGGLAAISSAEKIAGIRASVGGAKGPGPNYTREVAAMNIKARKEEMATQRQQYVADRGRAGTAISSLGGNRKVATQVGKKKYDMEGNLIDAKGKETPLEVAA